MLVDSVKPSAHHHLVMALLTTTTAMVAVACGPQPGPETTRGLLNAAIVCASDCPMYPALAPDGSVVVTRDEIEKTATAGDCPRPTEWQVSYIDVPGDAVFAVEPALDHGSPRPLEGYEALTCVDAAAGQELQLQEGHKALATEADGTWTVQLLGPDGSLLAKEEWANAGVAFCPSETQRVVVTVFRQSPDETCPGPMKPTYGVMRY